MEPFEFAPLLGCIKNREEWEEKNHEKNALKGEGSEAICDGFFIWVFPIFLNIFRKDLPRVARISCDPFAFW